MVNHQVICFNLDLTAPVLKRVVNTNANNYFGYSIAQHSAKNGKYILVGAPKDTYQSFNQSGAVYKCPFNLDDANDCEQITVDFNSRVGDECKIFD